MNLEVEVNKFFATPRPNVRLTILHRLFQRERKCECAYSTFVRLSKRVTKVQTIRTGAAEIKLSKMAETIAHRVTHNINMYNTIAIDEKPFVPKSFLVRSARVAKSSKGPLYESMLYGLKMDPVYLIAAVNKNGLICYQINRKPINTEAFESFILHVSFVAHSCEKQNLLFDNATFHEVHDYVRTALQDNNFEITKTPPSGCFCDPIEEFFAIVDDEFKDALYEAVVATGSYNPLTHGQLVDLVENCVLDANRQLTGQFRRALL